MPSAWAATIGRVCSKAPSVAERAGRVALARLLQPVLQRVVAAQQMVGRNPAALELQLRGVRRAAAELLELAHHLQPGRPAGHHEQRLAAVAELGVDGGVDHVHVGDPAVADPDLVAVDDPVVAVAARAWSAGS